MLKTLLFCEAGCLEEATEACQKQFQKLAVHMYYFFPKHCNQKSLTDVERLINKLYLSAKGRVMPYAIGIQGQFTGMVSITV